MCVCFFVVVCLWFQSPVDWPAAKVKHSLWPSFRLGFHVNDLTHCSTVAICKANPHITAPTTLTGTPVHLLIHALIRSASLPSSAIPCQSRSRVWMKVHIKHQNGTKMWSQVCVCSEGFNMIAELLIDHQQAAEFQITGCFLFCAPLYVNSRDCLAWYSQEIRSFLQNTQTNNHEITFWG